MDFRIFAIANSLLILVFGAVRVGAEDRTVTFEILVVEGDVAPGVSGNDGIYEGFASEGAISASGHIAFGGLASGYSGTSFRGGFWALDVGGSGPRYVALNAENAPGVTPALDFSSIAGGSFSNPTTPTGPVNAAGQYAFRAEVNSGVASGVWRDNGAGPQLIAATGQVAGGIGGGVEYNGVFIPTMNESGTVAFRATLKNGGVTTSNDTGIWTGTGSGTLALIARESGGAPGTLAGTIFDGFFDPLIVSSGEVGFIAGTDGPGGEIGSGFWAGTPGSLLPLVKAGDSAPGFTAGSVFGAFDTPDNIMSWTGSEIAFRNSTDDDGTFRIGIWAGTPGSLQLIVATGLEAPGLPGIPLSASLSLSTGGMIGNPVMAASGHVAFRARLDTNHPSVTSSNDNVLFYGPIGSVAPLLREGDPVPGAPGKTVSSFSIFDSFEMGSDGRLSFDMSTSPFLSDSIWIAYPDGEIVPLALDGDTIDREGLDWEVEQANFMRSGNPSSNFDFTGLNGSDGRPSPFGSNGTFLFSTRLDSPVSIFDETVLVLATVTDNSTPLVLPEISIALDMPTADDVRISLTTVNGQTYSVYRSSDLGTPTLVQSGIAGTGNVETVDDVGIIPGNPVLYYHAVTTKN